MDLILNIIYLLARYIHIVCTTLLVGGTLFYEMVVPVAIADLKPEQQMAIFARARWVFKRIVMVSVILMMVSGVVSSYRHWDTYVQETVNTTPRSESLTPALRPGWWWAAHASCGCMALLIAFTLTTGATPSPHSIRWMRLNMIILLIVVFLGAATRHLSSIVESPPVTTRPATTAPVHAHPLPDGEASETASGSDSAAAIPAAAGMGETRDASGE